RTDVDVSLRTCGTLVYNCSCEHTHTLRTEQLIVNPYVVFFVTNEKVRPVALPKRPTIKHEHSEETINSDRSIGNYVRRCPASGRRVSPALASSPRSTRRTTQARA